MLIDDILKRLEKSEIRLLDSVLAFAMIATTAAVCGVLYIILVLSPITLEQIILALQMSFYAMLVGLLIFGLMYNRTKRKILEGKK